MLTKANTTSGVNSTREHLKDEALAQEEEEDEEEKERL
jgi:hypothetical protein